MELKCPKCNRKNILYRQTDNKYWCRQCGEEWEKEESHVPTKENK